MEAIKEEFEDKIQEIDIFFELLKNIDSEEICLKDDSILTDLNKILKASFFLMLYNMVESTMRESVVAIYDRIDSNGVHFNQLGDKLRKKILGDCKKNYIGLETLHGETSNDIAKELLKASLSEKNLFSGNIDNDLIKNTAVQYGFSYSTDPNRTRRGEKLRTIKNYRNDLAHGNTTFSEVGRSYSLNQLKEYKEETIAYMEKIIDNIDYYLTNQWYLSDPNG